MCYELIGNKEKAETLFLQAVTDASDKTVAREELAKFYRRAEQGEKLTAAIDQIIAAGADADNERGMISLRADGRMKIREGLSTADEVLRVTQLDMD